MALYKFRSSDIFYNRIQAHQKCEFFINNGNVYYNKKFSPGQLSGSFTGSIPSVNTGELSVLELNIDRTVNIATDPDDNPEGAPGSEDDDLSRPVGSIRPFMIKGAYPGNLYKFKNMSDIELRVRGYGDVITGSYPIAAKISRKLFSETDEFDVTGSATSYGEQIVPNYNLYDRREIRALKNTLNSYSALSKHYCYIFPPDL